MLREFEFTKSQHLIIAGLFFSISPTSNALEPGTAAAHKGEGMSISVGMEFDSGNYSTADTTDTWRVPFGLQYQKGAFFTGLSVPYISTKSTGTVILSGTSGKKKVTTTNSSTTVSKASGLGDLNLYAGYSFPASNGAMSYTATARIKLATADENKGLGTGENDYALEAGLLNPLEKYSLFASIGYQINGDTATVNYDDTFYANAGISFPQSNNKLGVMLDFAQAANPGFDDALQLTGFMNMPMANKRSLYLYAMHGLSDGSPDYGLGANYRFGF